MYAVSTPYDMEVLGAHRGFLIEVQMDLLLLKDDTPRGNQRRKLVMSNPTAVEKYLTLVKEKFRKQNIFQRSKKLLHRVQKGHTSHVDITFNGDVCGIILGVFGVCYELC